MKAKQAMTLRPKYALWLLVALLGSTWYIADPQARPVQTPSPAGPPGVELLSVHPADSPSQTLTAESRS